MAYPTEQVRKIVSKIPFEPGIYMMKDEKGTIIYVGKAISLRKRVRQYFQKNNKSPRIEKMVTLIRDISYIVTQNEVEALALECNYIKNHNPKFNVMLKDDKTYPYIKITINDPYPLIYVTRRKVEDGSKYFGPYTNVGAMRQSLEVIKKIFPLKRCKTNLQKHTLTSPCLYYHIGKCLGPCINEISLEKYRQMIQQVILFLEGKDKEIEELVHIEMEQAIEKLEFEKAKVLKERLDQIEKIKEKQAVSNLQENSADIFGYIYEKNTLCVQIFKIRDYKIVLNDNLEINEVEEEELEEDLTQIITRYYLHHNQDIPNYLYVKIGEQNLTLLNRLFKEKKMKLKAESPKRGRKLKLIRMVENNILIHLEDKKQNVIGDLSKLLGFKETIDSIECYDISNLRNEDIVGCMIRFEDGKLNKKMYRKFRIKTTLTQDDPKCMYEVLTRRLKHKEEWPLPDAIFLDGGKTQMQAVKRAFDEAGEYTNLFGLVKNDKHRTRGIIDENGKEFDLTGQKKILNFLTYLQDEVHRFVITYHRSLRDRVKLKENRTFQNKKRK